jgi:hypothetical protein
MMHAAPKPPRPPCPVHSGYCSPTPPRSPRLPPSCSPSRATGMGGACLYAIPDEPRFIMRPPRLPRPGHPGSCSPTPPRPTRLPPPCSPSRAAGMGAATSRRKKAHLTCVHRNAFKEWECIHHDLLQLLRHAAPIHGHVLEKQPWCNMLFYFF